MVRIMYFLLAIGFLFSCSDNGGSDNQLQPSNLVIEITESETEQGLVTVEATAENAEFYSIDFGDGFIKSTDGIVSNQYESEGTYSIVVRANATDNLYVEDTESIIINFVEEVDDEGYSTPLTYDGYSRVWQDEFDGNTLSSSWSQEIGTGSGGWGNNELQYYRPENTSVENGFLTIEARKENFGGQQYTSSRIVTQGKQSFQYGRIDIRAKLPEGQGLWPALWMLGSNFSSVGWPYCGEIDIMEMVGGSGKENTVHGTLHWDNNGSKADYGESFTKSSGDFTDEFHVFTIVWDETNIKWLVNDQQYLVIDITPADLDEFQKEFFFIFNVAVGGNWPGAPDASTSFPQSMIVDYVRVFQKN